MVTQLKKNECCSEECISIPDEIEESLKKTGGIAGLKSLLPDEVEIEKAGSTHRALADPIRIKILSMLKIQPLCVCVIKAMIGIADSKLSYHISVLKKAGLILGEQQGNWIIYRLTEDGEKWAI